MGGSRTQTVGWKYPYDLHFGLAYALDSLREVRAGDATAWQGRATSNTTIRIDAPNLWGGDEAPGEGGMVGDMDLMLGNDDQEPHPYLQSEFDQHSALRGKATVLFRNTIYGSYNPYAKTIAFKGDRFTAGWPGDDPWYPETVRIGMVPMQPLAVYFALDLSGSMNEPTSNGSTRLQNMQVAVSSALDFIAETVVAQGGVIDIMVVGWGSHPSSRQTILRRNVGQTQIDELKTWVNTRSTAYYTYFPAGLVDLASFSSGAPAGARRIAYFVTDGEPGDGAPEAGTPMEMAQAARALLDGVPGVELYGINIDLQDITYTAVVDNTPADGVPVIAGSDPDALTRIIASALGGVYGMNPAHMLYYSKISPTMEGLPVAMLDDAHWRLQADRLYGEAFGLCTEWVPGSESVEAYQQRICDAIGGYLVRSRRDGKWRLHLARGAGSLESLPVLTDDDILEWNEDPSVLEDAVNALQTQYFDPAAKEEAITPAEHALASIEAFGGVITETYVRNEIPAFGLAARVNSRQLHARSTPLRRITPVCARKAALWDEGTYVRLQCQKRGIVDMAMLLIKIDVGETPTSAVGLILLQDIHSMPAASFIDQQPPVDLNPPQIPLPVQHQRLFEIPYTDLAATLSHADLAALPPEVGYVLAVGARPGAGRNYVLMSGADGEDLENNGVGDWCPTALAPAGAGRLDSVIEIADGSRLDRVQVGTPVLWDDEICRLDALDLDAVPPTAALGRGCADTVPNKHDPGSRLWFYGEWAASDRREYATEETVRARLLTRTGSGELPVGVAPEMSTTLAQRHARPYPPGRLRINGEAAPEEIAGDIVVEWAYRDRVMQADQLIDSEAGDVGPEPGWTVSIEYYEEEGSTPLAEETGITTTAGAPWSPPSDGRYRIESYSVMDGLESWQRHVRVVLVGAELWTPAHLQEAPAIWLDRAGSLVSVTPPRVNSWGDRSGNSRNATASGNQRPSAADSPWRLEYALDQRSEIENLGALSASVTSSWIFGAWRRPSADAGNVSRPVVTIGTAGTTVRLGLFAGENVAGGANRIGVGGRRLDADGYSYFGGSAAHTSGDWVIGLGLVDYADRTVELWVNGVLDATHTGAFTGAGATSATNPARGRIASNVGFTNIPSFEGDIAAVMVGGALPSRAEIDRMSGWAARLDPDMGLVAALPADHPFRHVPPYVNTPVLQPSFSASPTVIGFIAAADGGDVGVAAGPAVASEYGTLLNSEPALSAGQGITITSDGTDIHVRLDGITLIASAMQAVVLDHTGSAVATMPLTDHGGYWTASGAGVIDEGDVCYIRLEEP